MTELLNGRPTPSTHCFNALPEASSPLLFSISSHTLMKELFNSGGVKLRENKARWKVIIKTLSINSEVLRP